MSKIVAARVDTYDAAAVTQGVADIITGLGGAGKFISPGEKVLIKPNMLEGLEPAKAVTTHPWIVREVPFSKENLSSGKCEVFQ